MFNIKLRQDREFDENYFLDKKCMTLFNLFDRDFNFRPGGNSIMLTNSFIF